MKWTSEAEAAIKKIPFFVRKRVRARVEKEAWEKGIHIVSINEVKATQKRYLTNMASEIKGYQIDTCFGPNGCPNRANEGDRLFQKIEAILKKEDLLGFLKGRVKGDLKFHHEFRVSLADCPNACSQPQITDIGIIGACAPMQTEEACSLCKACVDECKEDAITLDDGADFPSIDFNRCLNCGKCIAVCPTGTLTEGKRGFRVQLGGRLGRHPRLARELPGIFSEEETVKIVKASIGMYKEKSLHGERFSEIFQTDDFENFAKRFGHDLK
ncbi:MAG: 4Fe-4S binding protein [Desulfobacterales bacterium]